MARNLVILVVAALVIALPFLFRRAPDTTDWKPGDPVLVIITPMNEAIRYEFGRAFSAWHQRNYGRPVNMDWRAIGGSTEIMRYLASEYITAARAWWTAQGKPWPPGAGEVLVDKRFDPVNPPALERDAGEGDADFAARTRKARERWEQLRDLYVAFRQTDDPGLVTSKIDMLFGAGQYDHSEAFRQGLTVAAWPPGQEPRELFELPDGTLLIPEKLGGETWRSPTYFGNVLSTFGICYNFDRLHDLGVSRPPAQWGDLADPFYVGQVGVADPTKSGSIAKAFEMIIQQKCYQAVRAAGFTDEDIDRREQWFGKEEAPPSYAQAIEKGWVDGLRLIQRIGANARYFTDAAGKIPVDVGQGDAAAGLAIDFYGRYQAQCSRAPDGRERMLYLTPVGGSSVGADPIGLLRGAEHRDIAVRFITFLLTEAGQKLWCYRPGTPGGPEKFALRRLPIRRDFYPSTNPVLQAAHREHRQYAADDLADPTVNPYALAENFTYRPRWTASHFNVQRSLIKAMCLDSADELKAAWRAIVANGGPEAQPEAMRLLGRMPDRPEPLTWQSAPGMMRKYDDLLCMREWTDFFRDSYREAEAAVKELEDRELPEDVTASR